MFTRFVSFHFSFRTRRNNMASDKRAEREERDYQNFSLIDELKKKGKTFLPGCIRGDALANMLKKLGVTKDSKGSVAMFVTNMALLQTIDIPAGCPVMDESFLAVPGEWVMVMLHQRSVYISTIACCPFTLSDQANVPAGEYISEISTLCVSQLAKIGTRFNDGNVMVKQIGDKFRFSQGIAERSAVTRSSRQSATTIININRTDEECDAILHNAAWLWQMIGWLFQFPYRIASKGDSKAGANELRRFSFIRFTSGKDQKHEGDAVVEEDTEAFCQQVFSIQEEMFRGAGVVASTGDKKSGKRARVEDDTGLDLDEDTIAALLAARNDDDEDDMEEESDITKEMKKRAKQVALETERVESGEVRPYLDIMPEWVDDLSALKQTGSKRSVVIPFGDTNYRATCMAEMFMPESVVRVVSDLCGVGNVATTYLLPIDDCCYCVVMSHFPESGVQSMSLVNPRTPDDA